jgi:SAM-dependent methyltransferase
MVTPEDVLYAYRLILGREPESEAAVKGHLDAPTLSALRRRFMEAAEFVPPPPPVQPSPLLAVSRREIDVDAGPNLKPLLDRVYRAWSRFGEDDPFYSVLTHDRFRRDKIAENMSEFYASGEGDITRLMLCLDRNRLGDFSQVVELGCGVGRLSERLASRFPSVIGLDVSKAHLRLAEEHCLRSGRRNVAFRQVRDVGDLDNLPAIDLFYSVIVLQHNPPPVILAFLERLASKMAKNGVMYFQVPTHLPGYRFRLAEYLRRTEDGVMEMHAVPQGEIFRLLEKANLRLVEVLEDDWAGIPGGVSNTFVAQRI